MGQLVHTVPEGRPVRGVTSLAGEIYLLRDTDRDQVEVYDVITCRLQRRLTVTDAGTFVHMTSCEHYRCVYIGDPFGECVHRLDQQGAATRWSVNNVVSGLSVNAAHNVMVTCCEDRKIIEFSPRGEFLRDVILPDDVIDPRHAIQLTSGQFIVCQGYSGDRVHRVCKISSDGRHVVQSHGGHWGSDTGQYNWPRHLAIDDNEFVFVADYHNRRVTSLSPTLGCARQAVSRDQLAGQPVALHVDSKLRLLYVAVNRCQDSEWKGHLCVFSI